MAGDTPALACPYLGREHGGTGPNAPADHGLGEAALLDGTADLVLLSAPDLQGKGMARSLVSRATVRWPGVRCRGSESPWGLWQLGTPSPDPQWVTKDRRTQEQVRKGAGGHWQTVTRAALPSAVVAREVWGMALGRETQARARDVVKQ